MKFSLKTYTDLTKDELYHLLQLRAEVFVVEQTCAYQDIDGLDEQALHVIGKINGSIEAYARIFPPKVYFDEAAIGRVVVKKSARKQGFAHQLMQKSIQAIQEHYQTSAIKLSAQQYLIKFYEDHGFQPVGTGYLEDGIPHIAMLYQD